MAHHSRCLLQVAGSYCNDPTTAERTINILRSLFSRHGIPDQIVTDNGPQFTAEEFNKFCLGNGIKHTLTAPYHPSTNGEAERFVQTFKTSIQSTPNTTTGKLQLRSCLVETSRPECSLASTFKRKTLSTRQVKE